MRNWKAIDLESVRVTRNWKAIDLESVRVTRRLHENEQLGTNGVSKNAKAESTMDRLLQRYFVIKLRQATLLRVKVDTKKLTMNWATLILFPKHESNPKNYKYF